MAIKMKRGTTESWSLGPELVHFENSPTKDKDSVIRAEGTELEMYVYTESANEWIINNSGSLVPTDGKIPGLPIKFGIQEYDDTKTYRLIVDFDGPEDCAFELVGWNANLMQPDYVNGAYIDTNYQSSGQPAGFVKWPAEQVGVTEPTPVRIRVSLREVGAYEELEEGQLGLEYTEDGNVKLKAGMPGVSKWNELPYIGSNTNILLVTMEQDEENERYIASHTPIEMATHMGQGGTVLFTDGNLIMPLISADKDWATFMAACVDDFGKVVNITLVVHADNSVRQSLGNTLLVTIDAGTHQASHTLAEILSYANAGLAVVLDVGNNTFCPLSSYTEKSASFMCAGSLGAVIWSMDESETFTAKAITPLIVTYNKDNDMASIDAFTIDELLKDGYETAIFKYSDGVYMLTDCNPFEATFVKVTSTGLMHCCVISDQDQVKKYEFQIPATEYLSALDKRITDLELLLQQSQS